MPWIGRDLCAIVIPLTWDQPFYGPSERPDHLFAWWNPVTLKPDIGIWKTGVPHLYGLRSIHYGAIYLVKVWTTWPLGRDWKETGKKINVFAFYTSWSGFKLNHLSRILLTPHYVYFFMFVSLQGHTGCVNCLEWNTTLCIFLYVCTVSLQGHNGCVNCLEWNTTLCIFIPPATKLGGVYWNHPVRPSVRPSVDARLGKMVSSA